MNVEDAASVQHAAPLQQQFMHSPPPSPGVAAVVSDQRLQLAILQTLERMENKENARSVSSLPYGIKIGEYRELPEGRKHVRLWAEGVEPWFKLAGWRVEGHEAHMKCILYLSTRLAASKSASGWWRGQRQLHGDYGGFSTVQGFLKHQPLAPKSMGAGGKADRGGVWGRASSVVTIPTDRARPDVR